MFEEQENLLFAEYRKALAEKGKVSAREYLTAVYEMRRKLDKLVLPTMNVNPDGIATHNIMRFIGYGPGTMMPNSGIRGMIPERDGYGYNPRRVLLQRRADSGEWGIPSGFVDLTDIDEASAFVREAREEAGITVIELDLVARTSRLERCTHTYPNGDKIRGNDNLYRVLRYEGEPNLTGDKGEESKGLRFFSIDSLPDPFVEMHRYPVELYMRHLETGKFIMG